MIRLPLYYKEFPLYLNFKETKEKSSFVDFPEGIPELEELKERKRGRTSMVRFHGHFLIIPPRQIITFTIPQGQVVGYREEEGIPQRVGALHGKYFPEVQVLEVFDCYLWGGEADFELRKKLLEEVIDRFLVEKYKPKKVYLDEDEPAYPEKSYEPLWGGKRIGRYLVKEVKR